MSYRDFFLPREVRWSWQEFGCHSDELELFLLERCAPVQATGCWEWTAKRLPSGYGVFFHRLMPDRWCYAHRTAQQLWNGPLTSARPHTLHSCDNPPCLNPEHLRSGSAKENMADRDRRGRAAYQRTDYIGRSRFSDEQLAEMFAMRASGASQSQIARVFGADQGAISNILNGKSHAHRTAHLRRTEAA